MHMVMPILSDVGAEETRERCATAMEAFAEAGVTTVVEMALDPETLQVMAQMRDAHELSTRIVAHMIVHRTGDSAEELAGVAQAAEFKAQFDDDRRRVVGIKLITDGTVDGCTAALNLVVVGADAAGLQIAIHAIGDQAIGNALDAFELAKETNGTTSARHRIEHLEYATDEDIARLGQLEIAASMQPVHADPTILENWSTLTRDPLADGPAVLLETDVAVTIADGRVVHRRPH